MSTALEDALRQTLRSDELDGETDVAALLAGVRVGLGRRERRLSAAVLASAVVVGVALGGAALGSRSAPIQPASGVTEPVPTSTSSPTLSPRCTFGEPTTTPGEGTSASATHGPSALWTKPGGC